MLKKIKETEAIKIYVLKDKSRKNVWIVEPPHSIKSKFDKKHAKGIWCFDWPKLKNTIKEMTRLKLLNN